MPVKLERYIFFLLFFNGFLLQFLLVCLNTTSSVSAAPLLVRKYFNYTFSSDIYGVPKLTSGTKLKNRHKNSRINPEELGEYFEGDILVPILKKYESSSKQLEGTLRLWEDGIVPYEIEAGYTNEDLDTIRNAIKQFHKLTCVRFIQKKDYHKDYLWITNSNTGCWSSIGKIGGRQQLNLQSPECLYTLGSVIHQLMHSLGFLHEQNRSDRNDYVDILWENMNNGSSKNFQVTHTGLYSYDYESVLHFSDVAFTKNGKVTVKVLKDGVGIGQRNGFSKGDVEKVNKIYNCSSYL